MAYTYELTDTNFKQSDLIINFVDQYPQRCILGLMIGAELARCTC